eukprot:12852449-Alexandrium_andersonii.AAC.1
MRQPRLWARAIRATTPVEYGALRFPAIVSGDARHPSTGDSREGGKCQLGVRGASPSGEEQRGPGAAQRES